MKRSIRRSKKLLLRALERRKYKLEKRSFRLKQEYEQVIIQINELVSALNSTQENL